jgi:phosphatidylserine decarboxylase
MGWFEHGSTIIVFAPPGVSLSEQIREGGRINMGQALMQVDSIEVPVPGT